MIKIPTKFNKCGIRIHCLKCRTEVKNKCPEKNKGINLCQNADKHKFKLLVHVPNSTARKIKILDTDDFNTALIELNKFKEEVKSGNFNSTKNESSSKPSIIESTTTKFNLLVTLATEYLDALSGINTPTHLIRKRSADHIKESARVMERFCLALKTHNYNLETVTLQSISQTEVGLFCDYILNTLKLNSYNKHCVIMKAFYNWCIDVKDVVCKNPFEKLKLSFSAKQDKTAITQDEFAKLLDVTTYESGFTFLGSKKINLYHNWLPIAFRLALETGLRAEEVVTLKFNDLMELKKGVLVFKIINLKVWRLQTGEDNNQKDKYVKYVPVTASLMQLLLDADYSSFKGTDKTIIPYPNDLKHDYVRSIISRSFTHFVKQVTNRKIEYKDLRKTYITHLTMALGDKTKFFTGHSNDAIIQNNYLADSVLASGLSNVNIFGSQSV